MSRVGGVVVAVLLGVVLLVLQPPGVFPRGQEGRETGKQNPLHEEG